MDISQKLQQQQSLVMTPQLQQAIKLLELSNIELTSYLETELLTNPLLTVNEGDIQADDVGTDEPEEDAIFDDENIWTGQSLADKPSGQGTNSKENYLDRLEVAGISLRDHLRSQLYTDITEPIDRFIGSFLIDIIAETGYLPLDYKEQTKALGISYDRIEQIIILLQAFDPAGIFARNLSECLRIQITDKDLMDEDIEHVLDHLDLFESGDIKKIEKICGVNTEKLRHILHIIRSCDPKPGLKFSQLDRTEVIPDILLGGSAEKGWTIQLNDSLIPRIMVDENYLVELKKGHCKKSYLTEKHQAASSLVKALRQRAQTIMSVTEEIVRRQNDFFENGIHYLKPMTLQDIAKSTELHESTISRVTQNKYIQSPRGTFELKFFFTSSIYNLSQEEDISSRVVKQRIKELIEKEEKDKPISDDQLVKELNIEGLLVARRTVAKYRDALKIPSSFIRKRQHAARF